MMHFAELLKEEGNCSRAASDVAAITEERDALIGEVQSLRQEVSDLKKNLETMREDSASDMWCREANR
jgi:predicted nuclease with TOPRIM domain